MYDQIITRTQEISQAKCPISLEATKPQMHRMSAPNAVAHRDADLIGSFDHSTGCVDSINRCLAAGSFLHDLAVFRRLDLDSSGFSEEFRAWDLAAGGQTIPRKVTGWWLSGSEMNCASRWSSFGRSTNRRYEERLRLQTASSIISIPLPPVASSAFRPSSGSKSSQRGFPKLSKVT